MNNDNDNEDMEEEIGEEEAAAAAQEAQGMVGEAAAHEAGQMEERCRGCSSRRGCSGRRSRKSRARASGRDIAKARRPTSEGAALAQWKWLAMLRKWRLRSKGGAGDQKCGRWGVASAKSATALWRVHTPAAHLRMLAAALEVEQAATRTRARSGGDAANAVPAAAAQGHGGGARGGR